MTAPLTCAAESRGASSAMEPPAHIVSELPTTPKVRRAVNTSAFVTTDPDKTSQKQATFWPGITAGLPVRTKPLPRRTLPHQREHSMRTLLLLFRRFVFRSIAL